VSDNKVFAKVENLTKKYGKDVILENISFDIQKGQVLVLMGPSGCGKSTLLRCLNGLEEIQGGNVYVDGFCINKSKSQELHKARLKIGMVFQRFNLFPHMTALDNITLAPIKLLGKSRKEADQEATRLLEMVGLPDKAKVYPCSLSGGQSQRIAIARALAMKPALMLFDEPTSALDPEMKEEVLNVILRLRTEERMTMVVVTHEIHFAKDVADLIMMVADKKIVEENDAKSFFDNPIQERTRQFLRMIDH
jgi:ABC-type polar amino acid transport system ATPase subunit